ncbi:MAG: hypothetical protein R6U11_03805 [Bacteroidales bacterium]
MVDEMMETFQKKVLETTIPKLIQGEVDPRRVTRAVFLVLPLYLERKAITGWIQNNRRSFSPLMFPQGPRAVLPEINTPHEAAELVARELMLNSQEKELVKIIVSAGEGLQNFCGEIESSLTNFQRNITYHHNSDVLSNLTQEQIHILADIAIDSGKIGRILILEGHFKFPDWIEKMKEHMLDALIQNGLDERIAIEIIESAWTTQFHDDEGIPFINKELANKYEEQEQQKQQKQKNAEDAKEIKIGNEVYYAYLQSDGAYIIDTVFTNLNYVQETCKALNIEFEDRGYKFVIEKNIKDPNNPFSDIDYTIKAIAIDNYNRMIQLHKEDISTKVLKEILPPDRFQEMMALRELVRQKNEEMYQKQALAKKQNPEQNTGQEP